MSTSFRPMNEVWGEHSSCFVNGDLMLWVLLTIATEAETHSEACEYGDKTLFWIEDGGKFLEFVASNRSSGGTHSQVHRLEGGPSFERPEVPRQQYAASRRQMARVD